MSVTSDMSDADLTDITSSSAQTSSSSSGCGFQRYPRQDITPNVRNTRNPPRPLQPQGGRQANAPERRSNTRARENVEREKKARAVGGQSIRAERMMEEAREALMKLQAVGAKGSPKEKRKAFEANVEILRTTSKRVKYNGFVTPPPSPGITPTHGHTTTQTTTDRIPLAPELKSTRSGAKATTAQTATTRSTITGRSTTTAPKGTVAVNSTPQQATIDWQATVPSPIIKEFDPHPLIDRDDSFFDNEFRSLQSSLLGFTRNFIQTPDNLNNDSIAEHPLNVRPAWSNVRLPKEFAFWAEQVATGGSRYADGSENSHDSWDRMMVNGKLRGFLVAGIIGKILERKVFGELLFGGRVGEKEMLEQAERELVFREGFSRTSHRARTVRYLLNESPTSENFYEDALFLTAEIHELLKPLYEWLFQLYPVEMQRPINTELYQELYEIVEHAAWLSICVRLSPTIFFMTDTRPGANYETDMHRNINAAYWTDSKDKVWKSYEAKLKSWSDNREIARAKVYAHLHAQPKSTRFTRQGKRDEAEFNRLDASKPEHPTKIYRAKCKISIFPNIKRFKPGSEADEEREKQHTTPGGISLSEKLGSREYLIMRATILCHYAPTTSHTDPISLSSFLDHVHQPPPLSTRTATAAKTGAKYALTGGIVTTVGSAAVVTALQKTGTLQDLGVYGEFLNQIAYPALAARDMFVFVGSEGVRRLNEYVTGVGL